MLGRNSPKWNSFKPGLLKNWSLRKSLHLDCLWLPRASTEEHRTPKIRGAYFSGSHHRQANFMFFILAQRTTYAQQQYQGT